LKSPIAVAAFRKALLASCVVGSFDFNACAQHLQIFNYGTERELVCCKVIRQMRMANSSTSASVMS
jgi:hypothetical protein